MQDSKSWDEFDGTAEPPWQSTTFIVRFERSVNNGAWTTVGAQETLNIPVNTFGGFQAAGEPYEPRAKGYFYDRTFNFTDNVPSTSSNVRYRLYVQRTSPTGTVGAGAGAAAGLRVITFTGERSAFNLNEIRGSTAKQFIDKDTGFTTIVQQLTFAGKSSQSVYFPTALTEVFGCTLGWDANGDQGQRIHPRYRGLSTTSVTVDQLEPNTPNTKVTVTVFGRVAI
mgnify:CR=1 FL=1